MVRKAKKKSVRRRYRALREIAWGDASFTLVEGQEFTEADLLPGMEAALRKWLRVGAAVEIIEEKRAVVKTKPILMGDEQGEEPHE